ncbi:MAG: avidin/streptavidin family protein [Candidatus Bipolaricaulota bacterium]|nr:avidin/streptavidin family protein [Candidatus Bipolaricaulota bacterium]
MQLAGVWKNEHGSIMEITVEDEHIEGMYSSHTGDTGTYRVVGLADPEPGDESQTFAFVVCWRSLDRPVAESGGHLMSAFVGQLQVIDGEETLTTMWMLAKPTLPNDNWTSMLVDKSIFKRRDRHNRE